MPNYKKYRSGRFLRKDDVKAPSLVTVSSVTEENVAPDGEPKRVRLIARLDELLKGLVLNMANCEVLAEISGSDETDDWSGSVVTIYHDPDVRFAGKRTGGIRLRKPETGPY